MNGGVTSTGGKNNNLNNTANSQNSTGNTVDLTSIVQQQPQSYTNLQHLQQQQQLIQSQKLQQQHHQQQLIEVQGTSSMDEKKLDELTTTNPNINDNFVNNDTLDNLSVDKNNCNPNASLELSDSCSNDITISDNNSINDEDDEIDLLNSASDTMDITTTSTNGDGISTTTTTTATSTTTTTTPSKNNNNISSTAATVINITNSTITTPASKDKHLLVSTLNSMTTNSTTTAMSSITSNTPNSTETGTTTITFSNPGTNLHSKNDNTKTITSCGAADPLNNLTYTSSNTNANITVAANIANTFINLSNLNASQITNVSHVAAGNSNAPSVASSVAQNISTANLNVIVSQPLTQHFVKTLTIGTTTRGIFVPNVIATNITPQFTVHHHQYGLHNQNHIINGPAPNVTVNPNGNFNTNSSAAVIRPAAYHQHFRPLLQSHQHVIGQSHNSNINYNAIGKNASIQSPILAASLQTINKIATNQVHQSQQQIILPQITTAVRQSNININKIVHATSQTVTDDFSMNFVQQNSVAVSSNTTSNKTLSLTTVSPIVVDKTSPSSTLSPNGSPPLTPNTPNTPRSITPQLQTNITDQQIRVLTPSEIMRTLPSLSTQDSGCCYESPLNNTTTTTTSTTINVDGINPTILQQYPAHSQQHQQQQQQPPSQQQSQLLIQASSNQSQCMSSPITITTTSSNAPPQTVRKDKKRKKYFHSFFLTRFFDTIIMFYYIFQETFS